MATLKRRKIYKNGGASYKADGMRASIYCGPRMFNGPAPETVDFDCVNPATPDAGAEAKKAAKEAKATERANAKAARDTERAEKKAKREEEKKAKAQKREEEKAARKAAKDAAAAAVPAGEAVPA